MFTTGLVVSEQVVKHTSCLKNFNLAVPILFVLVKVGFYGFLEMGLCFLECFRFLLLNLTHKIVELKCLLVVDANDLFRACLKQSFDTC
jgi:hypothetical protein